MLKHIGYITLALLLVACADNDEMGKDPITPDTPDYDLSKVEVSDIGYISVSDFYSKIVKAATEGNSEQDQILLKYAQEQLDKVKQREQFLNDSLNNVHGTNGEAYGENWDHSSGTGDKNRFMWFQYCTLRYQARGALGRDEELSELVIWPYGNVWDPQPDNVVVGCHCTILSNAERPTDFDDTDVMTDLYMFATFANSYSQEALVVIPDYEGYGATHGNTHPYIDREVLAHQVVEGTKAAIAWYQKNSKKGLASGWRSVAIGYSQGGNVAASVLRYCQEHDEGSLRMAGAVCGGGCYDPEATMQQYIDRGRIYMPISAALMIKSCLDTQPELREMPLNQICTQQFIDTGIFDWIQNKNYITEDIQNLLLSHSATKGGFLMYCWSEDEEDFLPFTAENMWNGNQLREWDLEYGKANSYCTPEAVFTPEVIAYFKENKLPASPTYAANLQNLRQVLRRNALYYAWKPQPDSGFTFFHSIRDEVVPYAANMQTVADHWGTTTPQPYSKYDYYNSNTYLHVATGTAFFTDYCRIMVEEIIKDKWKAGNYNIQGGLLY